MSFNGDGICLLSGGKLIFKCYLYGFRDKQVNTMPGYCRYDDLRYQISLVLFLDFTLTAIKNLMHFPV